MKNCNTNTQQNARGFLRIASVTAFGMAVTFAAPQAGLAQSVTPPPVPAAIQLPVESQAFLLGRGVGTQNYICLPSRSLGRVVWTLFTPQATLFDDEGGQLTTHFFSPNPSEVSPSPFEAGLVRATWQDSRDTSTVWGRVRESSVDAAFVTPGAIPWLLVEVTGKQAGPTGGNALSATTFIHRVNTVAGAAPATGCDLPTDLGNKAFVPYAADYIFYKK
jgi:Protein of unknown function (DUF3455)